MLEYINITGYAMGHSNQKDYYAFFVSPFHIALLCSQLEIVCIKNKSIK